MKCKIGVGKSTDIQHAIKEATANFINPKFMFISSEVQKFKESFKFLCEKYPNAVIMGSTGASFSCGQVIDNNISIFAIEDGIEISAGIIKNISKYPLKYISEIESTVNKINAGAENTVCLEVCTCNEEVLVSTLNSALSKKGIPLVGGTTQGNDKNGLKYIGFNGSIYEDACAYVVIKNLNGKIKVFNESIYNDRNELLIATKVDTKTREILELNGKNAVDVYCDKLGISPSEIKTHNMINPLGRKVGNDIFITAINSDNDKKTLKCYKKVNKNDVLTILELGNYNEMIEATLQKIKSEFSSISGVFSINCIVRYLLFKKLNYIGEYSSKMNSLGNHFGIIGDGEQFINQHVNQTMVCVVFE
ncbi:MAG: hypothetical protein E7207_05315 [Clostridium butyricum]|nr:hypothetical protein [Clostridium butyricum]